MNAIGGNEKYLSVMSMHKLYINMLSFIIFIKFLLIRISLPYSTTICLGCAFYFEDFISRIFMKCE